MAGDKDNSSKASDSKESWAHDFKEHVKEFVEATPEQHVT